MVALHTTPENFRAEIGRHLLVRKQLAELIGMHPNQLTNYVNGNLPLPGWAAHNIGKGINQLTGMRLLDVNDALDYIRPELGRPKKILIRNLGLQPYKTKRQRRGERWYKRRQRELAAAMAD